MRDVPGRLRTWWAASVASAIVFILVALTGWIGTALVAAIAVLLLVIFSGARLRRRAK